ncbi:helix-turn-helix domain-containing protein [Pseudactinotalea sp. Z1732]|uniref:helix-turn-helix domain-containing protein n=1 Tax=Micrococcales TaxID=85006 RepID=UPI003C7C54C4
MDTHRMAGEVARNVSQAIVTQGQTKQRIAEVTGIPYSTLSRKLLGRSEFTFTEIALVADALGVSPASLIPDAFTLKASA